MTPTEPETTDNRENDPRFQRTRQALLRSLIELVDAEPDQTISITRLVEAAGVSRPTFYQHFPDVGAALQQAALDRIAEVLPPFEATDIGGSVEDQVHGHILPALEHLERHRAFYLRVIETAASASLFEELVLFVRARMGAHEQTDPHVIDIVAGGAMWLVVRWLRGVVVGTPKEIAGRVAALAYLVHQTPEVRDPK